jgi:hypothetical protein
MQKKLTEFLRAHKDRITYDIFKGVLFAAGAAVLTLASYLALKLRHGPEWLPYAIMFVVALAIFIWAGRKLGKPQTVIAQAEPHPAITQPDVGPDDPRVTLAIEHAERARVVLTNHGNHEALQITVEAIHFRAGMASFLPIGVLKAHQEKIIEPKLETPGGKEFPSQDLTLLFDTEIDSYPDPQPFIYANCKITYSDYKHSAFATEFGLWYYKKDSSFKTGIFDYKRIN